jgi:hypothetical protein
MGNKGKARLSAGVRNQESGVRSQEWLIGKLVFFLPGLSTSVSVERSLTETHTFIDASSPTLASEHLPVR